ncbi:MAG: hypothetical protein ACXVNM_13830, partial [Bacteroidia bacterium]
YFDQFSGTGIKKYSKARFRKTLLDMDKMEFGKQKWHLWKQHIDWKNDGNQTDDICVFGCSVNQLLAKTN